MSTVLLASQILVRQGWFDPVQTFQSFKEEDVQDSFSEIAAPTPFCNAFIYVIFHTPAQCTYSCIEMNIVSYTSSNQKINITYPFTTEKKGNIF